MPLITGNGGTNMKDNTDRESQVLPESSDDTKEQAASAESPKDAQADPAALYRPEKLISFRVTREEALAACRKFYRGRWLLPKVFLREDHLQEMSGGYVPYLLHSGKAYGRIEYDAQDSQPQNGPGKIVKRVDNYTVRREGTVSYSLLPIIAPGLIPEDFMKKLEPFDFRALRLIENSKESAELGDLSSMEIRDNLPDAETRIREIVMRVLRETVSHDYVREQKIEVDLTEDHVDCILLPIYILTTKFGRRNYHFAVNGQTGSVYGDLPVHPWKLLAAFTGFMLLGGGGAVAVIELVMWLFRIF